MLASISCPTKATEFPDLKSAVRDISQVGSAPQTEVAGLWKESFKPESRMIHRGVPLCMEMSVTYSRNSFQEQRSMSCSCEIFQAGDEIPQGIKKSFPFREHPLGIRDQHNGIRRGT